MANFNSVPEAGQCDWYQLADVRVGIESEDLPLRLRFKQLYGECLSGPPESADARHLHCSVRSCDGSDFKLVRFSAPDDIDIIDFVLAMFRDRGYEEMNRNSGSWRFLGTRGESRPLLSARKDTVLVDGTQSWQPVIANCAVNWAMRLQPELLFFHAASVGIGRAGVIIAGAKGAGKSTLSLALAARGHSFLADEIAAVRKPGCEVVPFRRAVSIRSGPQAAKVERLLAQNSFPEEQFPDGAARIRAEAGELFPGATPQEAPLRCVFFLRGFSDRPKVEAFVPKLGDLQLLAPLACTYWGTSPALQMMQVARLLSKVRCYYLHPGMPDDTAKLIEEVVEAV